MAKPMTDERKPSDHCTWGPSRSLGLVLPLTLRQRSALKTYDKRGSKSLAYAALRGGNKSAATRGHDWMSLPDSYCRSSSISAVSSLVRGGISRCGALGHRDSTVGQGDD